MDVHIDEAGDDVETGDIDHLDGLGGGDIGSDLGDLAVGDGYVHDGADLVFAVDDVPPFEQ